MSKEMYLTDFKDIEIDHSWSFSNKTIKDTAYITHNYYTYPAKFIPQLVSRLIKEYSNENDLVVDPFMGSGTTIVESLVNNRKAYGSDINEIAYLISKVKTTPINIDKLDNEFYKLVKNISEHKKINTLEKALEYIPKNNRIDYWFKEKQKNELAIILYLINKINDNDIKDFFKVAFSQILKSSSIWLQKSIKPTRDHTKKEYDTFELFITQSKKMIKRLEDYIYLLNSNIRSNINDYRNIKCEDARNLHLYDDKTDLIITSPPYITSYEYADLHQLPALWFSYINELQEFRKKFIGSSHRYRNNKIDIKSNIAIDIILKFKNTKKAKEIENYYSDMLESFIEMKRILKPNGKIAIIIGNTQFKNIDILNAEVFIEQMTNIGLKIHNIIKREIPSKMLPSSRDASTGRFAKIKDMNKLVYPTEYIIIMEKR